MKIAILLGIVAATQALAIPVAQNEGTWSLSTLHPMTLKIFSLP